MRRTRFLLLSLAAVCLFSGNAYAQQSTVDAINEYGTFDSWSMRQVKESGIIGGATKTLYEFYGNQDTTFTGKTPRAAERVKDSITNFIEKKLHLKVNREKTVACSVRDIKFLGHSFYAAHGGT